MQPSHRPPAPPAKRRTPARGWIARRRRTALTHMWRGACYGIGTGLIGLGFMWLEQLL
ncbi:hypothetical protein ACPCVO_48440 [Streptomyces umbrinus]|uniref:hypothetical protein n=1 Tax=Streptomyces umbrinus TaxID=67370 RepID=UPI003C307161